MTPETFLDYIDSEAVHINYNNGRRDESGSLDYVLSTISGFLDFLEENNLDHEFKMVFRWCLAKKKFPLKFTFEGYGFTEETTSWIWYSQDNLEIKRKYPQATLSEKLIKAMRSVSFFSWQEAIESLSKALRH